MRETTVRIGDVLEQIDAGWSPLCSEETPRSGEWGVLKVSAVTSGNYRPEESKTLLPGLKPRPEIEVRPGDVIMCRANGVKELVGATAIVADTPAGLMLSDKTLRLVPDPAQLHPKYLYYFLSSHQAKSQIARMASGSSGQNNISQRFIRSLTISLPFLVEQQRIAEILDSADANIAATQSWIGKLESVSAALAAARLAHLAANAPTIMQLSSVATVLSGVTLGSEPSGSGTVEIPYLRVANVQDGYVDTSEMKTIRILRSDLAKYLLRKGDVLLTEGGDLDKLGRGTMWDARIPECICQNHIFRVRCDESRVLPGYLSLYIGSPMGKAYFLKIAKQTTNLASINSTQLKQMPLPIPSVGDQASLIELMASSQSKIETERQRLAQLQLLKQGLMDDLLTGRVRVTVLYLSAEFAVGGDAVGQGEGLVEVVVEVFQGFRTSRHRRTDCGRFGRTQEEVVPHVLRQRLDKQRFRPRVLPEMSGPACIVGNATCCQMDSLPDRHQVRSETGTTWRLDRSTRKLSYR